MPFGLCNAPATFQQAMNLLLGDYISKCCWVYLDDIIIWGDTIAELCANTHKIFRRFQTEGWHLQAKKCKFGFQEQVILGNLVGRGTLRPDPAKIECVVKLAPLKTKKELRSFLGYTGYFRRFIPNYAGISTSLSDLLKDGEAFQWTSERNDAFNALKTALTKEPIIQLPDHTKPFVVRTDASGYAIGAMLAQQHNKKLHPVAYWSRKLSDVECRYSTTEREWPPSRTGTVTWKEPNFE